MLIAADFEMLIIKPHIPKKNTQAGIIRINSRTKSGMSRHDAAIIIEIFRSIAQNMTAQIVPALTLLLTNSTSLPSDSLYSLSTKMTSHAEKNGNITCDICSR